MQYSSGSTRISGTGYSGAGYSAARPAQVIGSGSLVGTQSFGARSPVASSIRQAMPGSSRVGVLGSAPAARGNVISAGYGTTSLSPTANRPARVISGGTIGGTNLTGPISPSNLLASTRSIGSYGSGLSPQVIQSGSVVRTSPMANSFAMPSTTVSAGGRSITQAKVLSGGLSGASQYIGGNYTSSPTMVSSGYTASNLAPRIIRAGEATIVQPGRLSGPGQTAAAYETKHRNDDDQLSNLKYLKKACALKKVHVRTAAEAFKAAAAGTGMLTRDQFFAAHSSLLDGCGVEHPTPEIKNAVFDLFDRDDNGCVDMMEIVCGVSLLCKGSEDEKVEAVFMMFDENGDGYVTVDEMYKFLTTVFKVVCTPNVMSVVNATGVQVDSTDDMASATTMECFQTADLNHDGKLSLDEFKKWFYAPRNDPGMVFQPVKQMLN